MYWPYSFHLDIGLNQTKKTNKTNKSCCDMEREREREREGGKEGEGEQKQVECRVLPCPPLKLALFCIRSLFHNRLFCFVLFCLTWSLFLMHRLVLRNQIMRKRRWNALGEPMLHKCFNFRTNLNSVHTLPSFSPLRLCGTTSG